ncbi:hypothetical protein C8J57DRAFT_1650900, partial [Mycena rebaudengoi]
WLAQAHHIFGLLGITSNFEDYVLVRGMEFSPEFPLTTVDPPVGFLFLCLPGDFQLGPWSFTWPDFPAYWALDSSGAECLNTEEAARLGFPIIQLNRKINAISWDNSVYAGLRQFHQAKGFDPDSQD